MARRRKLDAEEAAGLAVLDDTAAETLDQEFDFSRSGQRFANFDDFQRFCRAYPQRQAVVTYIYRLWPAIDLRQVGRTDSALEKVTAGGEGCPADGVVTHEYLLRTWGSGLYNLMFNDMNRSKYGQIAQCQVTVDDVQSDPVLDPATLVISGPKGERNQPVIQRYIGRGWSIVERQNGIIQGAFRQLVPAPSGSEVSAAAAPPPVPAAVGGPQVVLDAAFLRGLVSPQVPAQPASLGVDKVFEISERIAKMASLGAAVRNPDPADPLAQIERYTSVMKALGWTPPGLAPVPAAAPVESGGGNIMSVIMKLPDLLRELRMTAQLLMPMPNAPVPPPSPVAPAPQVSAAAVATEASEPEMEDEEYEEETVIIPDLGTLIAVGNLAKESFRTGTAGDVIARQLYEDAEKRPVLLWLRSLGKEPVLNYLRTAPGMDKMVARNPSGFAQFIEELFSWAIPDASGVAETVQ